MGWTWLLIPVLWIIVPPLVELVESIRRKKRIARIVQQRNEQLEAERTTQLMRWAYTEVARKNDRSPTSLPAGDRFRVGSMDGSVPVPPDEHHTESTPAGHL